MLLIHHYTKKTRKIHVSLLCQSSLQQKPGGMNSAGKATQAHPILPDVPQCGGENFFYAAKENKSDNER